MDIDMGLERGRARTRHDVGAAAMLNGSAWLCDCSRAGEDVGPSRLAWCENATVDLGSS
jgi:hypothetical protein